MSSFAPARRLGELVASRWRRGDLDGFSAVASEALSSICGDDFSMGSIREWSLETAEPPPQLTPGLPYGSPAITLWHGGDFVVDTYRWTRFASGIHDHKFSGAFVVIDGLTADCRYEFEIEERIDSRVLLGSLRPRGVVLLAPGEVTPITAGSRYIHHPGHLKLPTQTLCVRLVDDPRVPRNYDYYAPGLAVGVSGEGYADHRMALIETLLDRPDELRTYLSALIARGPLVASLLALVRVCVSAPTLEWLPSMAERLPVDHPPLKRRVAEVIEVFRGSADGGDGRPLIDQLLQDASGREDLDQVLAVIATLLAI